MFSILGQPEIHVLDFGTTWIPYSRFWDNVRLILLILGQPENNLKKNLNLGQSGYNIFDFGGTWVPYSDLPTTSILYY